MDFDSLQNQRGTGSAKWDAISAILGRDDPEALPMWVAQMDFAPAPFVARAAEDFAARGQNGYFVGLDKMFEAVSWWCETRYGWATDPAHMRATHGLGNAIGLCLQTYSEPGDEVIIFTPVYHEFPAKITRNGRVVRESPLKIRSDGRLEMDLEALEASLTGRERIALISAPHNPVGRIWSAEELTALGDFCARHDLILISDEIHADIVFSGRSHVSAGVAIPQHLDRLVVLTAASKTFDIAGLRTSTVIIPDDDLRARFDVLHRALDIQPNRMGVDMTRACYTPEGAAWVDALCRYIEGNAAVFAKGIAAIPGLSAMPMDGTYLAWVDFTPTGMDQPEIDRRIKDEARIAPSPGAALGTGGELCQRFNLGTARANVEQAVARLQAAFADLQ